MVDSKENYKFGLGVKGLSEETQRDNSCLTVCLTAGKRGWQNMEESLAVNQ